MERRSFLTRVAAFLAIFNFDHLNELHAESKMTPLEPSRKPDYFLVDCQKVDMRALGTMTFPGIVNDAHPGDIFISYFPAPRDNFPAIMRVPECAREDVLRLMQAPHRSWEHICATCANGEGLKPHILNGQAVMMCLSCRAEWFRKAVVVPDPSLIDIERHFILDELGIS